MKVQEIMTKPVITAGEDSPLNEVAALMLKHQVGCVPIVNDKGELIGVITETDFMPRLRNLPFSTFQMPHLLGHWLPMEETNNVYKEVGHCVARELMTTNIFTVNEEDAVDEVVRQMLERKINHIPVLRNRVLIGMITRHDILREFVK